MPDPNYGDIGTGVNTPIGAKQEFILPPQGSKQAAGMLLGKTGRRQTWD
jgi:hypothetical protein